MKRILTIFIILLTFTNAFTQQSKTVTFNKKLGCVDFGVGVDFYLSKVTINKYEYILRFHFTTEWNSLGKCKIDNIYVGNYISVTTNGMTLGKMYNNPNDRLMTVTVPRKYDKLYITGVGPGDWNFTINLAEFDSFFPKEISSIKKISRTVYSTVKANVRNGAGTNFSKLGQLEIGEKLTLKEETENWYRFTSSRFSDGWIAKSLTTKIPPKPKDKEKPKINLYQPELTNNIFRTEEFTTIIKGKATDNEGIFQVYVNNETTALKSNRQFQKRIKLKIGKNPIEIKAIDINDNISIKEFLIIRDEVIREKEFSDIDFAFETSNKKPKAIAVVFGIEDYQYAPSVNHAYNDAEIMREYLISTFGLKRENIYFRYNERATKGEFEKVFSENGWIAKNADEDSEIYIFYAGHGIASTEDGSAYLIPNDIDPNYASTGYSLNELYQNLSKIKSKSTIIIVDACFSGVSRENEMLLADSRPISIKVKQGLIPKNLNVFLASSGNEISSGYSQKMHGLFTYFFLKGLNKNADINNDKKITLEEMENYLKENVSSQARKMGREQNPQLHTSDKNKVLLRY
ncbi:MAG: caspase family protein [Candidatus Cloacimonetes bacterium]|nr:caspase family protein [Candidatus Cloacimonadota bacterium]